MSWYSDSWQHMYRLYTRAKRDGLSPEAISKFIDDSYPWRERSGWAYKGWLQARKEFFRRNNLSLRHAKKSGPDLLTDLP
ncbi:hypothetical protein [Pseudomonas syringae]|nr:hypothetical protein [Pseudomonas syringae]